MKIAFDIHSQPPSSADIDSAREQNKRLIQITFWFNLPVFVIAFGAGVIAWQVFSDKIPIPGLNEPVALLWWFMVRLFSSMAVVALVGTAWIGWLSYLRDMHERLSIIDLNNCESALEMAEKHHEVEVYRKAVVTSRELTNGDFEAMKKFASEQLHLAALRAVENKQKEAFAKMHRN